MRHQRGTGQQDGRLRLPQYRVGFVEEFLNRSYLRSEESLPGVVGGSEPVVSGTKAVQDRGLHSLFPKESHSSRSHLDR